MELATPSLQADSLPGEIQGSPRKSCGSAGKESACNAGDPGLGRSPGDLCSNPWVGKTPGEEKGYPLQYSGLENSMEYIVHEVV